MGLIVAASAMMLLSSTQKDRASQGTRESAGRCRGEVRNRERRKGSNETGCTLHKVRRTDGESTIPVCRDRLLTAIRR
jgi:hypothetical protein